MRIIDWSSDVCSSDLPRLHATPSRDRRGRGGRYRRRSAPARAGCRATDHNGPVPSGGASHRGRGAAVWACSSSTERTRAVSGKSASVRVDRGGRQSIKKKSTKHKKKTNK